jgi:hypothetical protein
MFRIDDTTAAAALPTPEAAATEGFFTEGNPAGGTPATRIRASWLNRVQELLRSPLLAAGITPAKTDYDQLRQAIRRFAGANVSAVSATGALTADQAGLVSVSAASGAVTLTLPAANAAGGLPLEFVFVRTDTSANAVTIQRAGTDTIEGGATLPIPLSGRVTLRSDGTSVWRVAAEANLGRSLARPGWYRMPGGFILQWGTNSVGAGATATVSYPIAFPNAALGGAVTPGLAAPATFPATFNITSAPASASQFQISNNGASAAAMDWIILGH